MTKGSTYYIDTQAWNSDDLNHILSGELKIALSDEAISAINASRNFLESALEDKEVSYYGINTGFGALCNVSISKDDLQKLQEKLIVSHAAGTGDYVPKPIIKIILLLKIKSLCLGCSGVRLSLVRRLVEMYNLNLLPVLFQQGSLGASGDLAPLAHLSLPLLGYGAIWVNDKVVPAEQVLKTQNMAPILLESKEGLALINGTQFSTAYALHQIIEATKQWHVAQQIAAMSLEAFHCKQSPFDALIHQARPHPGQIATAENIRSILQDSNHFLADKAHVQDPYSFRCIPQVHGASKDCIDHCRKVVEIELNSVTDNPLLFTRNKKIISGGNFHAQPIAYALDFLSIALAELGNISERRTYQLISGQRGLPLFLVMEQGLNSGLMIPQYTAASIVSQNKQLCTPSSVDSIVSSNGQEDHVSMAANGATKGYKVVENIWAVLAIELFTAAQALHFRGVDDSASSIKKLYHNYRISVPVLTEDRPLYLDIQKSIEFIRNL